MQRWIGLILVWGASFAFADCEILNSNRTVASNLGDALFAILQRERACPTDVFNLKLALAQDGLVVRSAMVANRGRHNPRLGSFSFFEMVSGVSQSLGERLDEGTFYFGHFTEANNGVVDLDQSPAPGKLLIELIAWDFQAQHFNFYELIGTATGGTWFFRGNSRDAFRDNRFLHLQENPNQPQFGKIMRCSGCHTSGGPIMKEIELPHNDWWTKERPLPLAPNRASQKIKDYQSRLVDAAELARAVKSGQEQLEKSPKFQAFKKTLTLPEQLRALFCTTEINLISAEKPLDAPDHELRISPSFWVPQSLIGNADPLAVAKSSYKKIVTQMRYQFPETPGRNDADHGWLAPVKGRSDFLQIENLIARDLISDEFAADVLAVDFKNPLFSKLRCDLLRLVPENASSDWMVLFQEALLKSERPGAKLLQANLTDPTRTSAAHSTNAIQYIKEVQVSLSREDSLLEQIQLLQKSRDAVFANEISRNPRGQILEPGFRVIFPVPNS